MKKVLFSLTALIVAAFAVPALAQNFKLIASPSKQLKNFIKSNTQKVEGSCDTFNITEAANWTPFPYGAVDQFGNPAGYVFGPSDLKDQFGNRITMLEAANYFDASSTSYNYISGASVFFGYANSNKESDLSRPLVFKVYDDAGGAPGTIIGSVSIPLSTIKDDVDNGRPSNITFDFPLALPASKIFYFSVEHSAFKYRIDGTQDSIAVVSSLDDETTNTAYQYYTYNGSSIWAPSNLIWGDGQGNSLDVSLFIFPYLSETETGCAPLPVSLVNFKASYKNNQSVLSWNTVTEANNKGFYIERSADGKNFSNIAFVAGAGNSTTLKSYSYTDAQVSTMKASTVYYRLRQVDLDGKASFSGVLQLKTGDVTTWSVYPNPVNSNSQVQFNLTETAKVNVKVVAPDGRIVTNIEKGVMQAGSYTIPLNISQSAKGLYFVKLTIGDKTYTQTITK